MYFELLSEENYNLLVPELDLLTEEIVLEVDEQLRDGLLEAPFLIISAQHIVVIEKDAYFQLRELHQLLQSAGGTMLFTECNPTIGNEIEQLDFEVIESLDQAIDKVDEIVLNQDIDEEF